MSEEKYLPNIYSKALADLIAFTKTEGLRIDLEEEGRKACAKFQDRFSPESLRNFSDEEILKNLFQFDGAETQSLIYTLEFDPIVKKCFGAITGWAAYKFGLYYRKADKRWLSGSVTRPEELSKREAIGKAKEIIDMLVRGCKTIKNHRLDNISDYEKLDGDLRSNCGKAYELTWVKKYFQMIFPDKLVCWYTMEQLRHLLYGFGIKPNLTYYGMVGQVVLLRQQSGLSPARFFEVCNKRFGPVKRFYRLSQSDENGDYGDEWLRKNIVAVGWNRLGDLNDYFGRGQEKKSLFNCLEKYYYENDKGSCLRKSNEIGYFYYATEFDAFVVVRGQKLIGIADKLGPNYFSEDEPLSHCRKVNWCYKASPDEQLPVVEKPRTSCVLIESDENLMYLYKRYYHNNDGKDAAAGENNYVSEFERNRIIYGAPGTGKSYMVNREKDELLKYGGTYERVTFHHDYGYSDFVGTYKAVPSKDIDGREITTYKYVPGPFMRVLAAALKNQKEKLVKPHLLIIEEINRARVASVFGEIFQLLDRDENDESEFPICISEDMKLYLAHELGCMPEDCSEIKIPGNMFIWATMNTAEQGVFPLDTAFKRRWNFKYIGIDRNDEFLNGKKVIIGKGSNARNVEWNSLRKAINDRMAVLKINEDKMIGPYFFNNKLFDAAGNIINNRFILAFVNKLLMYLYDDAAKLVREKLFADDIDTTRFSNICNAFEEKGIFAFHSSIVDQVLSLETLDNLDGRD